MDFSYGIIAIVGVLVAISLVFIAYEPDDIIEPRVVPVKEKPSVCTAEYMPVCGVDGKTYGNSCMLNASDVKLDHKGECGDMQEKPDSSETLPMSITISVAEGSGSLGCDDTNECFLPYKATVAVGATVTWSNTDTAAHTVTSGTVEEGSDGTFDSRLFMSGSTFEFTFDNAGTYDYFCKVHPWMSGIVNVN